MTTSSLTPALQSHLAAQCHFMTELSRKMLDTAQGLNTLNMHLAQELIADMTAANARLLSAGGNDDMLTLALNHAQPGVDRLRQYQQQLASLLASASLDLKSTAETHLPETRRTAAAFADELVRTTAEETEKAAQRQCGLLEKLQFSALASNGAGAPSQQAR